MLSKINYISLKRFPISFKLYYSPFRCFSQSRKDYYKTLGVSKTASEAEIKKAFYNLAKQHHPDLVKGSEDKFKEINEAYEVLSDSLKKRQYDESPTYTNDASGPSGAQYGSRTTYNYGYGKTKGNNQGQNQYQQDTKYHYTSDKQTDDIKDRWYREYVQSQKKQQDQTETREEVNQRLRMARKKAIAFSLCFLMFFLIFEAFPASFKKRTNEYMLYDEKTNTVYKVDPRTYNEWVSRKGFQPNFRTNESTKFVDMTGNPHQQNRPRQPRPVE